MASILIVDDDAPSRLLLATLLEHAGHCVRSAGNGREALALLADETPNALITDLSMSGLSGAELVRSVRGQTQYDGVRIILSTATPKNAVLSDFMEMYNVCGLLPKPGEPEEIVGLVASLLSS